MWARIEWVFVLRCLVKLRDNRLETGRFFAWYLIYKKVWKVFIIPLSRGWIRDEVFGGRIANSLYCEFKLGWAGHLAKTSAFVSFSCQVAQIIFKHTDAIAQALVLLTYRIGKCWTKRKHVRDLLLPITNAYVLPYPSCCSLTEL